MINFQCECGKKLVAKDTAAGKRVRCPACKKVVLVPAPKPPDDGIRLVSEPEPASAQEPMPSLQAEEPSAEGAAAQGSGALCPHCRVPMRPSPAMLSQFGHTEEDVKGITFYAAKGCEKCKGWGYSGRVAVAELLIINEAMQRTILERKSSQIIKQLASGTMETIREDGWNKIRQGITTFDDVMRQTQRDQVEDGVGEF